MSCGKAEVGLGDVAWGYGTVLFAEVKYSSGEVMVKWSAVWFCDVMVKRCEVSMLGKVQQR